MFRIIGKAGILVLPLLAASPAFANNFTPPQGCKLEVTVQNRGCSVSQIYRCSSDPKGEQRSAIFGEDGLRHESHIDAETRWVYSRDPVSGIEDYLVEQAKDHASFSTLIETGRDTFDFWTQSNTGEQFRNQGYDELTGKTVTIDGIELEETQFELTTTGENGQVLIEREGNQYINRAMGRFYGGVEQMSDWTGESRETNDSPVLFSFPGEKGFGDTTPQFDCGEMVAQNYNRSLKVQL